MTQDTSLKEQVFYFKSSASLSTFPITTREREGEMECILVYVFVFVCVCMCMYLCICVYLCVYIMLSCKKCKLVEVQFGSEGCVDLLSVWMVGV